VPGFDCEWSVKDGAVELIDAYRRFGLTKDDFDRRFTRLAWLAGRTEAGRVDATMRCR
jgi:hypothetical protein